MVEVIQEFAKRIGIGELPFSENGVAQLFVDSVGMIFFELQKQDNETELLLYMAKEYNSYDNTFAQKLLEFCSYDKGHYPPIYGSIVGANCVLGLRFSEGQLRSGADVENSIHYLNGKFNLFMQ